MTTSISTISRTRTRTRSGAALVGLLCLVVTAVGLVAAPASAASSYGVSVRVSRTVADVGQAVTLSGTVTGKGAARKALSVQRRVGTGAWASVATTRTSRTGSYAVATMIPTAGTVSYRVVAPRSAKVAQGVSGAVAVAAWRWLDLYDQPYLSGGSGLISRGSAGATFSGKQPPAKTLGMGGETFAMWTLAGSCDRVVVQAGLSDSDGGQTRTVVYRSSDGQGGVDAVTREVTAGQAPDGYADLSAGDVRTLRIERPDSSYVYVMAPRAHCRVNTLPVTLD